MAVATSGVEPTPPFDLLRPGRAIDGWSAVLLPYRPDGEVDWAGFEQLLRRTFDAGLVPAVNMDTGYANLIDEPTRAGVLHRVAAVADGRRWAAGAFVADDPGDRFDLARYVEALAPIVAHGGCPIVFQSHGLVGLDPDGLLAAYRSIGEHCEQFVAFELGTMFAPFGAIYDLDTYRGLLEIEACLGAKHSSLRRQLEWDRLRLRDAVRPEFRVFTGNDLAIDMVMFGSDYLLGLSAMAPDVFAARDAAWAAGDPAFFELNDVLAALGAFAFRAPVPAYKHDVAMFLALRGWIEHACPHPEAPARPAHDLEVLEGLLVRLGDLGAVPTP
ncbi:MAG: dihydrodipicolinate synthase family protein [Acidimicrobiia bacterium]|nr:dihydrodipicolinate synthase family protein [Acidimicrobiia bacterium]